MLRELGFLSANVIYKGWKELTANARNTTMITNPVPASNPTLVTQLNLAHQKELFLPMIDRKTKPGTKGQGALIPEGNGYRGSEYRCIDHKMVEGTTSGLANWSNKSPNGGRRKEGRSDWPDELLGFVGGTNVGEPLE